MIYAVYGKKLLWGAAIFVAAIVAFEVFLSFRGGQPIGTAVNAVIIQNRSGDEVTVKVSIDQSEAKTIQLPAGQLARIVDSEPNSDGRVIAVTGSVREPDGVKTPFSSQAGSVIIQLNKNGSGSVVGPLSRKSKAITEPAVAEWTGAKIGKVNLEIERPLSP